MQNATSPLSMSPLLPVIHGTTALFLGVGLARFSFSPVIPLLVRDHWYSAAEAQMLGAWGLAGYLLGCFLAQTLARILRPHALAALLAGLVVASFLVCSFPVAYWIAALWRTIAGFAGAVLMIACVAEASARLGAMGHGAKAGILFTGVGGGAVMAAILMPALSQQPVEMVSMVLTAISAAGLALLLVCGFLMPQLELRPSAPLLSRTSPARERAIFWVMAAYGMEALGGTPVAVYFVDYAAREVGISPAWSGTAWAAFGLGAIIGPLLMMRRANLWLMFSFALKGLAVLLLGVSTRPEAYVLGCFIVGFYTPGMAVQVANFMRDAAGHPAGFLRYWAWATTGFAVMQGASGFAASQLNQLFSSYRPVYWICAGVLFIGVICSWQGRRALFAATAAEKLGKMNS